MKWYTLRGGSPTVYKLAGKNKKDASKIARRTDVTIYSMPYLNKTAMKKAAENAAAIQKEMAARVKALKAKAEAEGVECDAVQEVYVTSKNRKNKTRQDFNLKATRRECAEWIDANFTNNDIFFSQGFSDEYVENAEEYYNRALRNFCLWYKKTFHENPKWLYVWGRGDKNGRLHSHAFIKGARNRHKREMIIKALYNFFGKYGHIDVQLITRRLGEICTYVTNHITQGCPYAHHYHHSKNLTEPVKSKPQEVNYWECKKLFDIVDTAETVEDGLADLAAYIEALPQMESKRITALQVNRFEGQSPSISMTIMDVSDDVRKGRIEPYRSEADFTYFKDGRVKIVGRIGETVYIGSFDFRHVRDPEEPFFQTANYRRMQKIEKAQKRLG